MFKDLIDKNKTTVSNEENEEYVLEIKDLHKSYGKHEVLKGINLNIKKGEVFGFIGKNGIGKSTTIDCVVGIKTPTSGQIKILGLDSEKDALEVKTHFGYVPSEPETYDMFTGKEYLEFIGSSYNMLQESFDKNYAYLKEKFDLTDEDLNNKKIKEYSHGMKQKVCLMASLIHNPEIWILDEPTVGLDIMVYETLLKMIRDFAKFGKTVFITTHNIDLVAKVCDRVSIINDGEVKELIDFNKQPLKRRELSKIFLQVYGEKNGN